jgi:hypothetical protein
MSDYFVRTRFLRRNDKIKHRNVFLPVSSVRNFSKYVTICWENLLNIRTAKTDIIIILLGSFLRNLSLAVLVYFWIVFSFTLLCVATYTWTKMFPFLFLLFGAFTNFTYSKDFAQAISVTWLTDGWSYRR